MSKIVFMDKEKTAQSHSTGYNNKSTCNVTFTERGPTKEQDSHVTQTNQTGILTIKKHKHFYVNVKC